MNLTKNFTLAQMTRSGTAARHGFDNSTSDPAIINNLRLLCKNILEPLYDYIEYPIQVTSGFRSQRLNKVIKGSKNSQHCFGQAADIVVDGSNSLIFYYILQYLPFDQLIWEFGNDDEPEWVHVSYSKKNRREALKSIRIKGKIKYIKYE